MQLQANVSQAPRNRDLRHSLQMRHLGAVELFRIVQSREQAVRGRERCERIVESFGAVPRGTVREAGRIW